MRLPERTPTLSTYDAIIVGGGPAGLSAALILGRCRRRILLCDAGQQRNRSSHAMHGYLTRDGIPPSEFLAIANKEIRKYRVEVLRCSVTAGGAENGGFRVQVENERWLFARKLLIATGVSDH